MKIYCVVEDIKKGKDLYTVCLCHCLTKKIAEDNQKAIEKLSLPSLRGKTRIEESEVL